MVSYSQYYSSSLAICRMMLLNSLSVIFEADWGTGNRLFPILVCLFLVFCPRSERLPIEFNTTIRYYFITTHLGEPWLTPEISIPAFDKAENLALLVSPCR